MSLIEIAGSLKEKSKEKKTGFFGMLFGKKQKEEEQEEKAEEELEAEDDRIAEEEREAEKEEAEKPTEKKKKKTEEEKNDEKLEKEEIKTYAWGWIEDQNLTKEFWHDLYSIVVGFAHGHHRNIPVYNIRFELENIDAIIHLLEEYKITTWSLNQGYQFD